MTAPTDHTVTVRNRFGITITAPVVYVKDLGSGSAERHIETNFYIEIGHAHPATYTTPGREAKGTYVANSNEFTERLTYVYKGTFERTT